LRAFLGLAYYYQWFVNWIARLPNLWLNQPRVMKNSHDKMHKNKLLRSWKLGFNSTLILKWPIKGCLFQLHIDWNALGLGVAFKQPEIIESLWWLIQVNPTTK
jgi:hypothetical protein